MSDELCDFDDKHSCASDSIANDINSDESDFNSDLKFVKLLYAII